eukprot:3991457-Ditylum_brightwellii.AAC.1
MTQPCFDTSFVSTHALLSWSSGPTRGNDKQASLKLYKALMLTTVVAFSSEIKTCKAAIAAKDNQLDFTKLTTIAKD